MEEVWPCMGTVAGYPGILHDAEPHIPGRKAQQRPPKDGALWGFWQVQIPARPRPQSFLHLAPCIKGIEGCFHLVSSLEGLATLGEEKKKKNQ